MLLSVPTLTVALLAGSALALPAMEPATDPVPASPPDLQVVDLRQVAPDQVVATAYLESTPVTLELSAHSIRRPSSATGAAPLTYRGELAGEPGSRVVASIRGGELRAMVWRAADPDPWWIAPADDFDPELPSDVSYVVRASDEAARGEQSFCPVVPDAEELEPSQVGGPSFSTATYVAEVVVEADYEYVQTVGTAAETEALMLEAMNFASAIYEAAFGIRFEVVHCEAWDTPSDPYDELGDREDKLDEFDDYVRANFGPDEVDLAQLFTGRGLGSGAVGIARLSRFCRHSTSTTRWATSLVVHKPVLSDRVQISTHEFGHSLSANHCDSDPDCGIMSANPAGVLQNGMLFGSTSLTRIQNNPVLLDCVDPAAPSGPAPVLQQISPLTFEALVTGGAAQTLDLTGTDLGDVHQVEVGSELLTLIDLRVVDDQSVSFVPPVPTAFGTVTVRALNGVDWSNDVTFDYVVTDPPRLNDALYSFVGVGFSCEFGGFPNVAYQVLVSDDPTTTPLGGLNVLANPIHTEVGALDALGLGSIDYLPPTIGETYTVQVLTRDSTGALFATDPVDVLYDYE